METKYVRVPFSVELAKEITNGTKEGRIVTSKGKSSRIITFDAKGDYNIIALIFHEGSEYPVAYTNKGLADAGSETVADLFIEIPEYMTFKDGDVLLDKAGEPFVYSGVRNNGYGYICGINYNGQLCFCGNENCSWTSVVKGRASESETQKLIDALRRSDQPRTKECLKKLGIEEDPKFNFKPFDKVVVRENDSCTWEIDFFMKYEKEFETHRCMIGSWGECLPFNEETEKLIGTTKSYNLK